ncbi:SMP-30/gluconolactonase/LRE family protein [Tateyamaria pelophila]|uniref:SMP-30/gluconolactonase/LRE family protein n=1 Tax=Tateyamaria pelophila TaxID=328415 RepID=UPI001CBE655A|nr:SMP-30/gluconolactonase/LRE family protein [Tateyamaria pelophila]
MMDVFSDTICTLGEGPLWHPERNAFFWFDILSNKLFCKAETETMWEFDENVSAAGWVDHDTLLIASQTALWRFDIPTGEQEFVAGLESDNETTRSNDGRADPQGGFWIGTMGHNAEPHAGAIYRYYRGELRKLFDKITVSNSICFAPDGSTAYFTDTRSRKVQRVALDADGWPKGKAEVFLDLWSENLNPDGSVVDAAGNLWNAQWGASRVAVYAPNGDFLRAIAVPASQSTCPAFGGPDLQTLLVTSAAKGLDEQQGGMTFVTDIGVTGQREYQVIL